MTVHSPTPPLPRLVVGVGAVDDSLETLHEFFAGFPDEPGMAFLLLCDAAAQGPDALERLAQLAPMPVAEVAAGDRLHANHVYVIPYATALAAVRGGRFDLHPRGSDPDNEQPVDHLFRSLALEYGPDASGVLLSSCGGDGEAGLRDIKAAGGLAVARRLTPEGHGIASGGVAGAAPVDLVLPVSAMGAALERFEQLPPTARAPAMEQLAQGDAESESSVRLDDAHIERLAALLASQFDFDLRVYKPSTIGRRVLRRAALSGLDDVELYLQRLEEDAGERQTLVRDLLISVTDFFRDPAAFRTLRETVIDPLVAGAEPDATLRVWVPACATGEEAYSIGIELLEAIDAQDKPLAVQMFATDIDQTGLAVARAGIYPQAIADRVCKRRLKAFFEQLDNGCYQVRPRLREAVSFAVHDLTRSPPFSRMDLVSCRNVLIYLAPDAQKHVLRTLHFALRPEGHLFLSRSEAPAAGRQLFVTVSKDWRIYRKVGVSRPLALQQAPARLPQEFRRSVPPVPVAPPSVSRRTDAGGPAQRAVLNAWVPPTVVVGDDGSILFMHGELDRYLKFPQGHDPRLDLASVIKPELATRARGVLYKCRRTRATVVAIARPEKTASGGVRITANPAPDAGDGTVILSFEQLPHDVMEPASLPDDPPEQEALIQQLEEELRATREDLQSTVEELESSNEQLRSSNEEATSMNEELQSVNEELEATMEELRSLNEELMAVNAQLSQKIEQVERAHDDLNNFFSSAKVATVFLDDQLRIKQFTPAAAMLLGIDISDMGRCVSDIARELLQEDLQREGRLVLEHLGPQAREIYTRDDRWITRQVLPYRTESRRVEGVVVTFIDITELKRTSERLALRERQQAVIAKIGLHALREGDLQAFMDSTVREVQQTLGADFGKILELQPGGRKLLLRAGVGWAKDIVGSAYEDAGVDYLAGYALQTSEAVIVEDLAEERRFSAPQLLLDHGVVSGIACLISNGEQNYGMIGAHARDRRNFKREDANFVEAAAAMIGSAISRHQTRLRLALEHATAQILAKATTLDAAVSGLLDCLSSECGVTVGELWWPAADGQLECRLRLIMSAADEAGTVERLGRPAATANGGLIMRAFGQNVPLWSTDLGDPSLFNAREGTEALGLCSAVALPVQVGGQALGVLAAYSPARLFADDILLRCLEGIGRALGEFSSRVEYERRIRLLAAITASSQEAILSYDSDGRIVEWLPGAERLFGYTAQEMTGDLINRIVPPEFRNELGAINARIWRGEMIEPYETVRLHKDGHRLQVSVLSSPVRDSNGHIIGISSSDRDVTRLKETERKLVEADRQKDEFIAMLGHELRNPLAAILSASELLGAAENDPGRLERTRNVIQRQSSHMAKLLDGLLDISRIVRGKIDLDRRVVDLDAVCRDVYSDVLDRLGGRKLKLQLELPASPVRVEGDHLRLTQIVDNLMSNAVKYTPDNGRVTLALRAEESEAVLEVRDNGIGIPDYLLPHVFDMFRQAEQALDRSRGGLGLGLALVRSLVELHGGRIEAVSEGTSKGSLFRVHLPLTRKAHRPEDADAARGPQQDLRILIIEDNEDSAAMLRAVLELSGHSVDVAHDGRAGIELAKERRPHAVLCDLGLPDGMTGFDVARALRADPGTRELRLVALSGYGRPEDKEHSREAGFDAHLTKPVDVDVVEKVLVEVGAGADVPAEDAGND